jgi:hypothetical protein
MEEGEVNATGLKGKLQTDTSIEVKANETTRDFYRRTFDDRRMKMETRTAGFS